jgi:hypothetical protein
MKRLIGLVWLTGWLFLNGCAARINVIEQSVGAELHSSPQGT